MANRTFRMGDPNPSGPLMLLVDTGLADSKGESIYAYGTMPQEMSPVPGFVTREVSITAGAGTLELCAAKANTIFAVHQCALQLATTGSIQFKSNAAGISGLMVINVLAGILGLTTGSNGNFLLPYSPWGWFRTLVGNALNLTNSVACAGVVSVLEIPV